MLLPNFTITQDEKFVICNIHAPYTKVSDVDIHIEDFDFAFFAKPYLLKLKFPAKVLDEGSSCKFEVDRGDYVVSILKKKKGQNFVGLDLLTSLLKPEEKQYKVPKIQVLKDENNKDSDEVEEIVIPEEHFLRELTNKYGYGFANQKSDVFPKSMTCEASVLFLSNPDQVTLQDRTLKMEEAEIDKFDVSYYIESMYSRDEFKYMFDLKPWWCGKDLSKEFEFDSEERETFMALSNRDYLLTDNEKESVLMGLVSVLFAYAYDVRVTDGEGCVESPWNIQIISPQLSWCCTINDLKSCGRACYRRVLCYPLYRHYDLCELMWKDVAKILSLGVRFTLRCLLKVRNIFESADQAPYYLLNRLYIDDYCIWLQKHNYINDEQLMELSKQVTKTKISKEDLDLKLSIVEDAAKDYVTSSGESSSDDSSDSDSSSEEDSDDESSEEESEEDEEGLHDSYRSEEVPNSSGMKLLLSRQPPSPPAGSAPTPAGAAESVDVDTPPAIGGLLCPSGAANTGRKLITVLSSDEGHEETKKDEEAPTQGVCERLLQEISSVKLLDDDDK